MNWNISPTPQLAVRAMCDTLLALSRGDRPAHVSLPGGSTPALWFAALAEPACAAHINWDNLHLWWGDERCVPPDHPESNFGQVNELLLRHITIPAENVHRIHGEENAQTEAARYASEIDEFVPKRGAETGALPAFDWIILGMGNDGHTASLFPGKTNYNENQLCIVASHPVSGGQRVSKSAPLLAAADRLSYLVLGREKAELLSKIRAKSNDPDTRPETLPWPAARIRADNGLTEWRIDAAAASLMS